MTAASARHGPISQYPRAWPEGGQHVYGGVVDAISLCAIARNLVAQRGACRILAGEGDPFRGVLADPVDQRRYVKGPVLQLAVVAAVALGEIGQADAQLY